MKNRHVGSLIIGISVIIGVIVLIFNIGLKKIVSQICTHGSTCPMYDTIVIQTGISLAIAGLIFVIGLFLIFMKEEEKIVTKIRRIKQKTPQKKKPVDYTKLNKQEKIIVKIIEKDNGAIFQSDIVEKSGLNKVQVTRILDKLEGRQVIERRRRGMANMVILKS